MLSELGGPERRLAVNALASAQVSFATIVGPLLAGLLLGLVSPGLLLAIDAASFAFLGIVAWRAGAATEAVGQPIDARAAESGFRLLRRPDLLSLTLVTWVFFFLYGPVEVALPVYVAVALATRMRTVPREWRVGAATGQESRSDRSGIEKRPSPGAGRFGSQDQPTDVTGGRHDEDPSDQHLRGRPGEGAALLH